MHEVLNRRPRKNLARDLVDTVTDRIRSGDLQPGAKLPSEALLMGEFGVSRTVVREAISRLQAAGLADTRHGVGTFVVGLGAATTFRIAPEQLGTLDDVLAVLELRIAVETESAALAAQRRTEANLQAMRHALRAFQDAVERGRDAVGADFQIHLEIARATRNPHFVELMSTLGGMMIPRARLGPGAPLTPDAAAYLRHVHGEHQAIVDAIARRDADAACAAMRTHLVNSRDRRRNGIARRTTKVDGATAPTSRH